MVERNGQVTVCGFSFGRDLSKLNYPVEASVRSVLPLCDRFVFVIGKSQDDTRDRVASIDQKIESVDSKWADVRVGGKALGIEGNKALHAAETTDCTWGFYIQADEVIHEDDLPIIRAAMEAWAHRHEVKALLFRFLHFALDYRTIDPWAYHKASRIVRLDGSCRIFGDGCGPGLKNYTGSIKDGYLDKHHLGGHVRWARDPKGGRVARIFHYGGVKTREQFGDKSEVVKRLWWGTLDEQEQSRRTERRFGGIMERYPLLKNYYGSHPAVMRQRIDAHPPLLEKRNRWLNPRFYLEVLRHGFAG